MTTTLSYPICLATFDRRLDVAVPGGTALPCRAEVPHALAVRLRRWCDRHCVRVAVVEDDPRRPRLLGLVWASTPELGLDRDLPPGTAVHVELAIDGEGKVRVEVCLPQTGHAFGGELALRASVAKAGERPRVPDPLEVQVVRARELAALDAAYCRPFVEDGPTEEPPAMRSVRAALVRVAIRNSDVLREATPEEIRAAQSALDAASLPSMRPDDLETWRFRLAAAHSNWMHIYDPEVAAVHNRAASRALKEGDVAVARRAVLALARQIPPSVCRAVSAAGYGSVTAA